MSDISYPDNKWKQYIDNIVKALPEYENPIHDIELFQKLHKVWPNHKNISSYCLYLGSYKHCDLYSTMAYFPDRYTSAIVFGDEDHEYMSGNFIGLFRDDRDHQNELFFREVCCNLIPDNILGSILKENLGTKINEVVKRAIKDLK